MIGGQSRLGSITETTISTVVGFGVAFTTQMVIFPWYGFHVSAAQSFSMGLIFTVVSIARSYLLRRLFNTLLVRRG